MNGILTRKKSERALRSILARGGGEKDGRQLRGIHTETGAKSAGGGQTAREPCKER